MDTVYKVKNITLDTLTRRVSVGVKSVHLTKTEYKILEYLLKNIGKAISREELLENIKGEESRLSSNMGRVAYAQRHPMCRTQLFF